jgi:uncharacterized protein with LGFP repeats
MDGQKSRGSTLVSRLIVALLTMGVAVLLAPVATATPESDAADAISAAWDASGGDGGPLGPKNGDVYPIGGGFGQNFASGKIFFTPDTGAHSMQGAILEKYESLGGPADSDLGFPTIDEGPGRAPDSRNTTFSASDKPVIFWTPATGARVVRGAINAAWDKLGGSAGTLGVPADDEMYRGNVVSQKFTGGELSFDSKEKTFTTVPPELAGQLAGLAIPTDPISAINAARRAAGGALGPLGAAEGEPYSIGQDGLGQNFAGGKIFYSPATGASVVTGQVLAKYESVGGPQGDLGFPVTSEVDGGLPTDSKISTFAAADNPVIFWTPDYGAVIVRGAMKAAWDQLGGATGELGAPMADQTENGDVVSQRFSGGVISWDRAKKTFSTEPSGLASKLSGLQVPGQEPAKAPNSPQASNSSGSKWFEPSRWWLLALVPVLVVVGLIAFAVVRNRRRGHDDDRFDMGDNGFGDPEPHAYSTVGAPERSATGGEDASSAMFGERYAYEGLGSLPGSSQPSQSTQLSEASEASEASEDRGEDPSPQASLWSAPPSAEEETSTPVPAEDDDVPSAPLPVVEESGETDEEDPDAVDTAPTPVATAAPQRERDPLTDTGRHARIIDDEPEPTRTAFRLAHDDPHEAPEGYPIKADTRSGLYFVPGSALYEAAPAEIWFSSEEFARTNGFVEGG